MGVPLQLPNELSVGDRVLITTRNHQWAIKHSPVSEHEFLIDEHLIEAIYEG